MRPITFAVLFAAFTNIFMTVAAFAATTTSFSLSGSGYYAYNSGYTLEGVTAQPLSTPTQTQHPTASLTIGTHPGAPLQVINNLPGGDITADYSISAFLSVDGQTILKDQFAIGTTTLNTLLSDPFLGQAVSFLSNIPLSGTGIFPLGGLVLGYDYTATAPLFSPSSQLSLTATIIDDQFVSLTSLLGTASNFGSFQIGLGLEASNIQAVPLPAGLPLMAAALGLMGMTARKRTKIA